MKILKGFLIGLLSLIGLVSLILLILFMVNNSRLSYLKTKNANSSLSKEYIIKNVNIIPMNKDTVLQNKMVQIKEGKIFKINDIIEKQGLETIDGEGKFLLPGLIDMHVHVWDRYELGLYLANGVTTVRNLWGIPLHLRIKKELENEELIGPMFFTSSPKLTGPEDFGDDKVQIQSIEQAKELVTDYSDRGYDYIKTYAGITEPLFDAIVEQAASLNLDVVSHPSFQMTYSKNFIDQVATIEHVEDIVQQPLAYQLDSVKLDSVIQLMAKSNISFSPTLSGYHKIYEMLTNEAILESEDLQYINPLFRSVDSEAQVARWQGEKSKNPEITENILRQHKFHLYIIKQLHENGINIVSSTDAGIGANPAGFSIHQELKFYKEAGLSNYEVLRTATHNASMVHKEFKDLGEVSRGKIANLILTSENPLNNLETLKEPEWVIIKGRLIEKKSLTLFKEKAYNRNNMVISALNWIENLLIER